MLGTYMIVGCYLLSMAFCLSMAFLMAKMVEAAAAIPSLVIVIFMLIFPCCLVLFVVFRGILPSPGRRRGLG